MDLDVLERQEIVEQIEAISALCGTVIRDTCDYGIINQTKGAIIPDGPNDRTEYIGQHYQANIGDLTCEALCYDYPEEYENPFTYCVGLRFKGETVFLAEIPIISMPIQRLLPLGQKEQEERRPWDCHSAIKDLEIPGRWQEELQKAYNENC